MRPLIFQMLNLSILYKKITCKNPPSFPNINHKTMNYIDDSSHIISFTNPAQLKIYLEYFHLLIHTVYVANQLKMNSNKTKIIFLPYKQNKCFDNFSFMAINHTIRPKKQLLLLGYTISSNLSHDNHINQLLPSLYHHINSIRNIHNVIDEKTRLELTNSIVIGKLNYALPFLSDISTFSQNKLHKIV